MQMNISENMLKNEQNFVFSLHIINTLNRLLESITCNLQKNIYIDLNTFAHIHTHTHALSFSHTSALIHTHTHTHVRVCA